MSNFHTPLGKLQIIATLIDARMITKPQALALIMGYGVSITWEGNKLVFVKDFITSDKYKVFYV